LLRFKIAIKQQTLIEGFIAPPKTPDLNRTDAKSIFTEYYDEDSAKCPKIISVLDRAVILGATDLGSVDI
jgi:hypothetical protein